MDVQLWDYDWGCCLCEWFILVHVHEILAFVHPHVDVSASVPRLTLLQMYNYTNGSSLWRTRLDGFLNQTSFFFPESNNRTMTEICEKTEKCNIDQLSFKAYLARWLAVSAQLAPFTTDRIVLLLQHSASAAAQSCVGGPTQTMCGSRWWWNGFDGLGGVGQQMSALSVISVNLSPSGCRTQPRTSNT